MGSLCHTQHSLLVVVYAAVLAQTSDIAELLTDYQIDLLRALEMSRLQFLREIGSLRPGTSDRQGICCYVSMANVCAVCVFYLLHGVCCALCISMAVFTC